MHRKYDFFSTILRAADGGAGGMLAAAGAADPAPAAPAAGQSATADAAKPAEGAAAAADPAKAADGAAVAPVAYVPDGLPDDFKGGNERETIDKLWGHLKANQSPPKPEDYTVTVTKELEGVIDPKTDPVLPIYRAVAKKHDLSQKQFDGVMADLFGELAKAGMIEKPVDIAAEFRALSDGKGDPSAQVAAGKRAAVEVGNAITALASRGVISQKSAERINGAMMARADDFVAMRELVAALEKHPGGLVPGGQSGGVADPATDEQAQLAKMYPSMMPKA